MKMESAHHIVIVKCIVVDTFEAQYLQFFTGFQKVRRLHDKNVVTLALVARLTM